MRHRDDDVQLGVCDGKRSATAERVEEIECLALLLSYLVGAETVRIRLGKEVRLAISCPVTASLIVVERSEAASPLFSTD